MTAPRTIVPRSRGDFARDAARSAELDAVVKARPRPERR